MAELVTAVTDVTAKSSTKQAPQLPSLAAATTAAVTSNVTDIPQLHVVAVDRSGRAVTCAKSNVTSTLMQGMMTVTTSDGFKQLSSKGPIRPATGVHNDGTSDPNGLVREEDKFDLVVFNPPWLPLQPLSTTSLDASVYDFAHESLKSVLKNIKSWLRSSSSSSSSSSTSSTSPSSPSTLSSSTSVNTTRSVLQRPGQLWLAMSSSPIDQGLYTQEAFKSWLEFHSGLKVVDVVVDVATNRTPAILTASSISASYGRKTASRMMKIGGHNGQYASSQSRFSAFNNKALMLQQPQQSKMTSLGDDVDDGVLNKDLDIGSIAPSEWDMGKDGDLLSTDTLTSSSSTDDVSSGTRQDEDVHDVSASFQPGSSGATVTDNRDIKTRLSDASIQLKSTERMILYVLQ